jgi:hypothetical protein
MQTPVEWEQWLVKKQFLTGETKEIWECYLTAYKICHGGKAAAESSELSVYGVSHTKTFDQIFHCIDPRWQECFTSVVRKHEKTLSPEARAAFLKQFKKEFDQFEDDEK